MEVKGKQLEVGMKLENSLVITDIKPGRTHEELQVFCKSNDGHNLVMPVNKYSDVSVGEDADDNYYFTIEYYQTALDMKSDNRFVEVFTSRKAQQEFYDEYLKGQAFTPHQDVEFDRVTGRELTLILSSGVHNFQIH